MSAYEQKSRQSESKLERSRSRAAGTRLARWMTCCLMSLPSALVGCSSASPRSEPYLPPLRRPVTRDELAEATPEKLVLIIYRLENDKKALVLEGRWAESLEERRALLGIAPE